MARFQVLRCESAHHQSDSKIAMSPDRTALGDDLVARGGGHRRERCEVRLDVWAQGQVGRELEIAGREQDGEVLD